MSLRKSQDREKKRLKRKNGMQVDSKSVFLIERLQRERAEKIKKQKGKNG